MARYICVRTCIMGPPWFESPRMIKEDGGNSVYDFDQPPPAHVFTPLDKRPAEPKPARATNQADMMKLPRSELEAMASAYGIEEPSALPNKGHLVAAILRAAKAEESSAEEPAG